MAELSVQSGVGRNLMPRTILASALVSALKKELSYIRDWKAVNRPALRYMAATTPGDKSHHKPSGGFVNPWLSFRDVNTWEFLSYRLKHWDHERSKVPPQNELYVRVIDEKKMTWDRIENPAKDRIQATWYRDAGLPSG